MGLFVYSGTLPSGVQVSNVYMSFNNENIVVQSISPVDNFMISASCNVFSDPYRTKPSDIKVPIVVTIKQVDMKIHPYYFLYRELKKLYPNSVDWIRNC